MHSFLINNDAINILSFDHHLDVVHSLPNRVISPVGILDSR